MCPKSHTNVSALTPRTQWRCRYNAEMRSGWVMRSRGKSFIVWMIILGCAIPQPVSAQRLVSPDSPPKPQASDSAPALATAPTAQPATPAFPPHAFWDRTNLLLFSGIAFTRGMDYASTRNFQARGRQEILLPDDVVSNSAGFASLEAAA